MRTKTHRRYGRYRQRLPREATAGRIIEIIPLDGGTFYILIGSMGIMVHKTFYGDILQKSDEAYLHILSLIFLL